MKLSRDELNELIEYSNTCQLKVIDDIPYYYPTIKERHQVDVFTYLYNKYPEMADIHIGFIPSLSPNKEGFIHIYSHNYRLVAGSVRIIENEITYTINGLIFKDDPLNQYLDKIKTVTNGTKDFHFALRYDIFGEYKFRCAASSTTLALRLVAKNLKNPNKTTQNFRNNECVILKNNEKWYETSIPIDIEHIKKLKSLYSETINTLMHKYNFKEKNNTEIKTIVNLSTGDFTFYKNLTVDKREHIILLNYIFNNYDELNTELYHSIIKEAETITSQYLKEDVVFADKEVIKSFLTLIDMNTI